MAYGANDSPFRAPPNGQPTRRPAAVIAVLAIVLLVCLLIAQAFVSSRTRQSQARDDARRYARELIARVASEGLSSFLGPEPIVRYYLLRKDGRNAGFAASLIEPDSSPDSPWDFRGRDILYVPAERRSQSSFAVTDDLARYTYSETIQTLGHGIPRIVQSTQSLTDGTFSGSYKLFAGRQMQVGPLKLDMPNVIPPPLRDLFASLTIQQNADAKALFVVPSIEGRRASPGLLHLDEFLIEVSSRVIPDDVRMAWPGTRMAQLTYVQYSDSYVMALDDRHQMVWQTIDSPLADTAQAVRRDELLQEYPNAEPLLNGFLEDRPDTSQPIEL